MQARILDERSERSDLVAAIRSAPELNDVQKRALLEVYKSFVEDSSEYGEVEHRMQKLVILSLHTSPLAQPGTGDGGGMNVYVRELVGALAQAGVQCRAYTVGGLTTCQSVPRSSRVSKSFTCQPDQPTAQGKAGPARRGVQQVGGQ